MKKICVYTCLTGNYDNLHEIEVTDKNVDFICYTNNENLKSKTWKIIYIKNDGLTDHQLSRKIKMLGTDYINKKYDISVWQDASVTWKKSPSSFVKKYLKSKPFSAFKHSYRDCVYDEAREILRFRKESRKAVEEHLRFLNKEKFPHKYGLYEMTVFIKKHNDPKVIETMNLWYDTYLKHSKRDQLSFMYAVWKTGLGIYTIGLNVWNNEWMKHSKHTYNSELKECRIYYSDSSIDEEYNYKLDYTYKYNIKKNNYSFTATVPVDTNIMEIDITNVPCVAYSNFKTNLPNEQITFYNVIPYEDKNIFYNDHGVVRIEGDFKKGTKFDISIDLEYLTDTYKNSFIEYLCNNLIILSEEIETTLQRKTRRIIDRIKKSMK